MYCNNFKTLKSWEPESKSNESQWQADMLTRYSTLRVFNSIFFFYLNIMGGYFKFKISNYICSLYIYSLSLERSLVFTGDYSLITVHTIKRKRLYEFREQNGHCQWIRRAWVCLWGCWLLVPGVPTFPGKIHGKIPLGSKST